MWPKGRHCGPAREKVGDERGRKSIVQVRRIAVFARSAPVCAFARGGGETFADSTMTLSTDPEQGAGLFSDLLTRDNEMASVAAATKSEAKRS